MLKNTLIGSCCGAVIGTVVMSLRITSALCPVLWPVANAIGIGSIAYRASNEKPVAAVIGGTAGFMVGAMCIPFAPVISSVMIVTSPLAIPTCAIIGGIVGYSK